ncbi:MAG TPA: hypothetical protein VFM38_12525, partial [Candidatus Limnocylindrales bacterium]|nr:hypothetical protein [Candidatus Limnocylindrales bacterium]
MTGELDTTRAVRAWLQEGVTRLPDRVLDEVLADVPATPQRRRSVNGVAAWRRSTWVRLLVALMTLVVAAASLMVATGAWRPPPVPRPFDARPLDAGRYVIDRPFPVRISLDLPAGWEGTDLGADVASIARSDTAEGRPALTFTEVNAIYPDPCHWADDSLVPVGPTDDLARLLAMTNGVVAAGPLATEFGGYAARHVTLTAPADFAGCTSPDDPYHLWGIPGVHSLAPGEHDEIWVTQVGATRLVAYSEVFPTTPPAALAELDAIVASVRLERFAAIAEPLPTAPTEIESWPVIADGLPLEHRGYEQAVQLHTYGPDGSVQRVAAPFVAALLGQSGWIGRQGGIATESGSSPSARLSWSSVATVYLDPCHWQTSKTGTAAAPLMRDQDGLTSALNAWWPTVTDSKVSVGYAPAPFAPIVTALPKAVAWNSLLTEELEITVPDDVDVSACDAGVYRLWETRD